MAATGRDFFQDLLQDFRSLQGARTDGPERPVTPTAIICPAICRRVRKCPVLADKCGFTVVAIAISSGPVLMRSVAIPVAAARRGFRLAGRAAATGIATERIRT